MSLASCAEANHVKFIHAHQIPKNAIRKPTMPWRMCPSTSSWWSDADGLGDGDDERQVDEQLERRRRPVLLVRVANHRAHADRRRDGIARGYERRPGGDGIRGSARTMT